MGKARTDIIYLEQTKLYRWYKKTSRWIKRILIGVLGILALLILTILVLKSRPLPPPDISAITFVYDDQGNVIDQMDRGEHREKVALERIPKHLIQATLAAEDRTFYSHWGFSLRGITRALWVNLKEQRLAQGASTITQQLAKNLYLTHDRTWSRKWKEATLTTQLELHFTKKEILEMYFNEIYYGNGAYGIQSAAKEYFHKNVEDLTLAESTFLAGIPRGPKIYSPYQHFHRAKQRQHSILDQMVRMKVISQADATQAKHQLLVIQPAQQKQKKSATYFRDYIIQTAVNQLGFDESLVRHGGLKIYTTLNQTMQKQAESTVKEQLHKVNQLQGALLSVDVHTGAIKAMVGGKDYKESQFNRVFAKRQPGSAFKPIVYLSALEQGLTPTTKILSTPTAFSYNGEVYKPSNFQENYAERPITMREAIAKSDNVYAVSTQFQIGMDKEIETARRLGIRSPLKPTPSLALGSYSVTPFEMSEAFTTIANGGVHRPLFAITKIIDSFGNILYEPKTKEERMFDPSYTYVLTSLMQSVFEDGGTGHRIQQIFQRPAAGKTGTTDWDGWIIGYTPDLLTTVWVGFDQNREVTHTEAKLSQHIWGNYMNQISRLYPSKIFPIPEGVKAVYIDPESGKLASPEQKNAHLEYFVSGTEPHEYANPTKTSTKKENLLEKLWNWWQNH